MFPARTLLLALASAILVTMSAVRASAGPPTICVPLETRSYRVLPEDAPVSKIVASTLRTLDADLPVIARMETLRRAALRLQGNTSEARQIMIELMARTLDREAAGRHEAVAWFDAGYFARCCEEAGVFGRESALGAKNGIAGYAWIERALRLDDERRASMHLAAALMTATTLDDRCPTHLRLAASAESDEPLVAANSARLRERILRIRGSIAR